MVDEREPKDIGAALLPHHERGVLERLHGVLVAREIVDPLDVDHERRARVSHLQVLAALLSLAVADLVHVDDVLEAKLCEAGHDRLDKGIAGLSEQVVQPSV